MYLQFFGLSEAPFSITPDPAFVYLSAAHRDALAHLMYGVGQGGAGGFVQLTGEVGTGKTTLCRCLLEQVPDETQVALVLNPLMTPSELLATICEELGISTKKIADSNKGMVDALNSYLLDQHARGRRVVVVIDEAQNLSPEALEQVRLLTNLETSKDKLLQMVLLGQPELRQLLQRQNLRQLSQRITARYHLTPLNQEETRAYVHHRMQVAGAQRNPFRKSAIQALYQRSQGIPRLINIIADRALAGAYARETASVTPALIHAAANEVQPSEARVRSNRWPMVVATASIAALLVVTLLLTDIPWLGQDETGPVATAPQAPDEAPAAATRAESLPPGQEAATADAARVESAIGSVTAIPVQETSPAPPAVLDPVWLEQQHRESWRTVAGLWLDPGNAGAVQSACDGDSDTGYACLAEQGNWSRIRQLGLPVVLILRGASEHLLPLRGFSGHDVLVGATGEERVIAREALEPSWFGEYYLIWPQAADWPNEIRRGESGSAVDIVMQMAANAEPAWQGAGIFDLAFEDWLKAFQRRNGLKADGIVGPNTLIYLMAPTITQPRLVESHEENT